MNFIFLVIIYIILLFIWSTVSLVAYAATIVFRKPIFIKTISGLSQAVGGILLFILTFYFLFLILSFFTSNIILIILGAFLIGSIIMGIVGAFLQFVIMPFMFVPMYLSERYEKDLEGEEVISAEVVDEKGHVIGKTEEGKGVVNKKLATYFLIDYVLIIFYVYLHRFNPQYINFGLGDYITTPIIWIASQVMLFGFFVLVYYLLRYRKLFPWGKKKFLLLIIKIDIVITSILLIFSVLLSNT